MIYLYSGTPGSGKSLHQASDIYYALKYGRPIVANFDIDSDFVDRNEGVFKYVPNDELSPSVLVEFANAFWRDSGHKFKEGGIRLYLDECQILFNARSWDQVGRSEWLKFFSQHRKYGYDIFLVAQFDRMLDRQIRSLIEYEIVHRKLNNYGTAGKVMSLLAGGSVFVCVKVWYPMRERVGSEFLFPRKKYLRIYDTYKLFEDDTQS